MTSPAGRRWTLATALVVLLAAGVGGALLLASTAAHEGAAPPSSAPTTTATPPTTTVGPSSTTTTTTTTTTSVPPTTSTVPPTISTTVPPPPTTTTTTAPPPSTAPAVPIYRGSTTIPLVALTFDAGSDVGHTSEILDILAANRVVASFGMTGRWAEQNPTLVRRIASEGHLLINHSYDHPSFTGRSTGTAPLDRAARIAQLERADASVASITGTTMQPWFRPPYGDEDESVRADVGTAGYRFEVMWSVDSLGWQGTDPADVTRRCLDGAEAGAIFLLHVGSASTDHAALQDIITGVRGRGLGFGTIAEVIR